MLGTFSIWDSPEGPNPERPSLGCDVLPVSVIARGSLLSVVHLQGSAKRWALGCVNTLPAARQSQETGTYLIYAS